MSVVPLNSQDLRNKWSPSFASTTVPTLSSDLYSLVLHSTNPSRREWDLTLENPDQKCGFSYNNKGLVTFPMASSNDNDPPASGDGVGGVRFGGDIVRRCQIYQWWLPIWGGNNIYRRMEAVEECGSRQGWTWMRSGSGEGGGHIRAGYSWNLGEDGFGFKW